MKKLFVLSFLFFAAPFAVVNAQTAGTENSAPKSGASIKFDENAKDFGDIVQGDQVKHTFVFTNTGTTPLIITDVQTTCGCTASSWPRGPILAGAKENLEVSFNSAGKMGPQTKVVTILSNAVNNVERVTITTNILPKQGN